MNFQIWLERKEKIPVGEIDEMVRKLHYYEDDFVEGDLLDRIYKYNFYTLKEIPISKIRLDEWEVEENRVKENIEEYKNNPNYPPIIYDLENNKIIDGIHRANALARLKIPMIKAYVGIPE